MSEPAQNEQPWQWRERRGDIEVVFAGRAAGPGARGIDLDREIQPLVPEGVEPAWLFQIHSGDVVEATAGGYRGEGDALVSERAGLALGVITADCVPVLLAAGPRIAAGRIAAVHAGWRGLVAGIIPATVERLEGERLEGERLGDDRLGGDRTVAWIGPSIGPCCYEVSDEVADQVVAAAGVDVRRPGLGERPHLDLVAAAEAQLRQAGVEEVIPVVRCTRCHPEDLWSYRREGKQAGRNLAVIWREPAEG